MTGTNSDSDSEHEDNAVSNDPSIQELLTDAMPELPEDRVTDAPEDEADITMSTDEQRGITNTFDGLIRELYDMGYTANELAIIMDGLSHRVNAARFDNHEYDRIALTLELRETINEWRDGQDEDIPARVIAETVEELGRLYRTEARKNQHVSDE